MTLEEITRLQEFAEDARRWPHDAWLVVEDPASHSLLDRGLIECIMVSRYDDRRLRATISDAGLVALALLGGTP